MDKARAHLTISGRVQGVCFRMCAEEEARKAGLTGWVRNLPTGRVEALAEGPREAVERLIGWCRKGPPMARVEDVDIRWEPYQGNFPDFRVIA